MVCVFKNGWDLQRHSGALAGSGKGGRDGFQGDTQADVQEHGEGDSAPSPPLTSDHLEPSMALILTH